MVKLQIKVRGFIRIRHKNRPNWDGLDADLALFSFGCCNEGIKRPQKVSESLNRRSPWQNSCALDHS